MNPIGIVVNPKLNEPLLVVYDSGEYVILRMLKDWPREGVGSLDAEDPAAYITGLPRSHTPSGLKNKGKGYGTSLYTGLCMGAMQGSEGVIDDSDATGPGISSHEEQRSSEAGEWWERAIRLGLATRIEDEVEDTATEYDLEVDDLNDCIVVPDDGKITGINRLEVEITRTREADAYTFDSADDNDLVPALFHTSIKREQLDGLWRVLAEHEDKLLDSASRERLLALDVRSITQPAMHIISVCARWAGASTDELDAIFVRWQLGLDPDEPIKQQRLPFKANSSEMKKAIEANEQAAELRRQLDWHKLATLP